MKLTDAQRRVLECCVERGGTAGHWDLADAEPVQIRGAYLAESRPFPGRTVATLRDRGLITTDDLQAGHGWIQSATITRAGREALES